VTCGFCCVVLGVWWFLLRVVTVFLGGFVGGGCMSFLFGGVFGVCGDATFA